MTAVAAAAVWGAHTSADQAPVTAPGCGRAHSRDRPRRQRAASPATSRAMLDRYCVACHNQRVKTADVAFDNADLAQVGEHAELWEKAIRKLRAGMMPPPGARRPEQGHLGCVRGVAGAVARCGRRGQPRSGPRRACTG